MKQFFCISICFCAVSFVTARMMVTGGWRPAEQPYSDDIMNLAKFATAKESASRNSLYHLKTVNVSDVQKQVVSGMNYKMQIRMGSSECKKNGINTKVEIENCSLLECQPQLVCNVTIWNQAWLNDTKITKSSCQPQESTC